MTGFTIEEIPIPKTVNDPEFAAFAQSVELSNTVQALKFGTDELSYLPEEEITGWNDAFERRRILVARVDGQLVGRADYSTHLDDDSDWWLTCSVLPKFRGRGIGTALSQAVEDLLATDGKPKAIAYTVSGDGPGERLDSPTGFGSVPRGNPEVQFSPSVTRAHGRG